MSSSNHRSHADYNAPERKRCMICKRVTSSPVLITESGVCCSNDCMMAHGRNLNVDLLNVRIDLKQRKNA